MPWTSLDLLESLLDRLITGEIHLYRLNGISRRWTFFLEGLDCMCCLLLGATAEEDMISLGGLQQRFDRLVADAIVATGDEDNLWGCHC